MTDDPPADAEAALAQLFTEARRALVADDPESCRETIASAQSVARDLSAGERRERLCHGCERVVALLGGDEGDVDAAREYVDAMERLLDDPGQ